MKPTANHTVSARELPVLERMALTNRFEAALRANPRDVEALMNLAGLKAAEGDSGGAIPYLKKALAIRGKEPRILRSLFGAMQDTLLVREAKMYGRKLCEAEPRNPANHIAYGFFLEKSGDPRGAIAAYQKALRLQPDNPSILVHIANSLSAAGDAAEARAWYEKAAAADPGMADAWSGISGSGRFDAEQAAQIRPRLEQAIAAAATDEARASMAYSLAKILDDGGFTDDAFGFWSLANRLKAPKTKEAPAKPLENMAAVFDRPFLSLRKGWGHASDAPIFILGMPRSGTTLAESLCGAHSRVTAADEQILVTTIMRSLGRDNDDTAVFRASMESLPREEFASIGQDYLNRARMVAGDETPHFTDKMPHNFVNIGMIHLMFPNARIIHCRRHPVDNCLSIYQNAMNEFHARYKHDLTSLGLYYRQYERLMEHWRTVLPGRMHEIFYEDVVANTEHQARAMIAHLGLDWEDGVMERSGSQRSVRTLSQWQVRQPVYTSSSGKWRRYEAHLGPLIEALGPSVSAYEAQLAALAQETGRAG